MARTAIRRRPGVAALLVALCALPLLLASCALPSLPPLPWQQTQLGPQPLPDAQQVAHIALPENSPDASQTLDPMQAPFYDPGQAQLLSLLYSGLVTFDAHLRPVPALAQSYVISPDGLTYTFHLRPAFFAEGTPITAADVALSLNREMTDCLPSASYVFADVKDQPALENAFCQAPSSQPAHGTLVGDSLLAPDTSTFVILLARPDAALLSKLAEPYGAIVEPSLFTRYGAAWSLHIADGGGQGTSGMYAVSAWTPWSAGTDGSLTLSVARNYWGQRPRLRQVIVALRSHTPGVANPGDPFSPALYALKASDDIAFDTTPLANFTSQPQAGGLRFHSAGGRAELLLALNAQIAPLDDVRVRQALALALDKTALAQIVSGAATNHLIPPGAGNYPAALSGALTSTPLTGDVAQAQALWQSYVRDRCGGVASRCPTLWLYNTDIYGSASLEQAEVARWQAELLGVHITISDADTLLPPLPDTIPMGDMIWYEDYPDPQDWLTYFAIVPGFTQTPYTLPYTHEAQADALVARAEATLDPTARLALYQQAENILLNDALVIPIAQQVDGWGVKPTVADFPANPLPWIAPAAWARIYLITAPASQ